MGGYREINDDCWVGGGGLRIGVERGLLKGLG